MVQATPQWQRSTGWRWISIGRGHKDEAFVVRLLEPGRAIRCPVTWLSTSMIVTPPAAAPVASRTTLTCPFFKPLHCASLHQLQQEVDAGEIMCEPCNGKGWLLCDFCKGQKTNVKADNKRIYRRCPSCRAIGSLLCSKCKVFKCVTFPDGSDGEELTL